MSLPPQLDESAIRLFVGSQHFQHGVEYVRSGSILDMRRRGMMVKARCQEVSGDLFLPQVMLGEEGIVEASCTCPNNRDHAEHCAHIAALLLCWQKQPEAFVEQEPLEKSFARYKEADLVAFLLQIVSLQPALERHLDQLLALPGGAVNNEESLSVYASLCRRRVKAAFHRNLQEWLSEADVKQELESIKSLANQLMGQQNIAAVATMLSTQVMTILEDDYFHPDVTHQLSTFLSECVKDLGECLRIERANASVRKDILQALLTLTTFYVEKEYYTSYEEMYTIILSYATSEEMHACARWLREHGLPDGRFAKKYQGFLLDLEADTLADEVFFQRARELGEAKRIVQRLLMRGRVEEAIQEAVLLVKHDYEMEEMASLFHTHGYEPETERLILERLKQGNSEHLQTWLREFYRTAGKTAQALEVAVQLFATRPSFSDYTAARFLAETLRCWEQVKPGLQAALSGSPQETSLLIEMALDDKDIDRALELRGGGQLSQTVARSQTNTVSSTELYIATVAEDIQPHRALEIYQRYITQLLAHRERKEYREACRFLLKVRHLYERTDALREWQQYISELKMSNSRLPAFLEELRNLHLEERA
jgi:uncharacterized Zn finger protein